MSQDSPHSLIATSLRREREASGLSIAELARRAGVAKSTLSQLESGAGNPSVETLWALAVALGVPFGELVAAQQPQLHTIRAGEGARVHAEEAEFTASFLTGEHQRARRDLYTISLSSGTTRYAEPHTPGSVEHIVLASGRLRTGPVTGPVELEPGDYARFAGDVPHLYEALAPETWATLLMEHP